MLKHMTYVKVTEVDANMVRFRNLEELTLTGNYIHRVNSHHLPRTLKVSHSLLHSQGFPQSFTLSRSLAVSYTLKVSHSLTLSRSLTVSYTLKVSHSLLHS